MTVERKFGSQFELVKYVDEIIPSINDKRTIKRIEEFNENNKVKLSRKKQDFLKGNVKNALIASKMITKEEATGYDKGRKPSIQGSGMIVSALASGNPKYRYSSSKRKKKKVYKLYINPTINWRDDTGKLTNDAFIVAQIVDYLQFVGIDIEIYLIYYLINGLNNGDNLLIEFPLVLNKKTFGVDYKTIAKYSGAEFFRSYLFGVFDTTPNIAEDFGRQGDLNYALNLKDITDEKQAVSLIKDNLKLAFA